MVNQTKIKYCLTLITVLLLSLPLFSQNKKPKSNTQNITRQSIESKYATKQDKITDYYLHAIYELTIKKDSTTALEYLKKSFALDSLHAPTLYLAGTLIDDIRKATVAMEKASELDPDNLTYKFFLGSLYSNAREYDKSRKLMEDIHSRGKHNINTFKYLSALYDMQGNIDKALQTIDSAIVIYGSNPELLSYKGEIFRRQNRTVAYLANCRELDQIAPDNAMIKYDLSTAYSAMGQDSAALATLHESYMIDSTYTPTLSDLTTYYAHKGGVEIFRYINQLYKSPDVPFDKKRDYFNDVIRSNNYYQNYLIEVSKLLETLRKTYNYNYEVESMYSAHFMALGQSDNALEIQRKFIYDDNVSRENQIMACNTIISTNLYLERPDSVMKYSEIALERFKDDKEEPLYIAYVMNECEKYNEAIDILKNNVKKIKDDSIKSNYYGLIGDIEHKRDKNDSYSNYYEKALKYNPDNIMVLNNYAYYLSLENTNLEKALEMSKRVIDKEPSNYTYIDTYAWILYLLGRYEDAKAHQLRAVAMDTEGNHEIFLHYADILVALNEGLNARRYYRKALENGADQKIIEQRLEKLDNSK